MSNDNSSDTVQTPPSKSIEADRMPWEIPKPNWDEWVGIKQAKLWVAVALAQNIEPKHFDYFRTGKLDTKFTQQPPQFTSLLTIAINNISAEGMLKPIFIDLDSLADSEISIPNFVKWIKSNKLIKVELPPGFPGTTTLSPRPNDQSSSNKNERSTLLILIAVLAKELQLDISYPSKTAGVIEELTTRLGAHVSARAIENHLKRIGTAYPKPLGERERTTLLTLIAALCKELKFDYTNSTRTASLIEGATMCKGTHIAATTIEDYLSRIPKALEKRSK